MEVRLGGLADSILHGDRLSGFPGRGLEAAGVREYQTGDEARGIDWRVTARTGRLHVREFEAERDLPFLLLLHRSPTLRGGRSGIKEIRALELAALLGAVALQEEDRVGLLQGGEGRNSFLPPARRKAQLLHLLTHLMDPPEAAVRTTLPDLMALGGKLAGERHRIFVIGDFQIPGPSGLQVRKGLAFLARRHALTPVRIADDGEGSFPGAPPLPLADPNDGRVLLPKAGRGREDLREALDRDGERIEAMFLDLGLRGWRVEVSQPLVPTLRVLLARDRRGGRGSRG
jgi:uncharacterized protein (DUF58 family)